MSQTSDMIKIEPDLWLEFSEVAKKSKKNPSKLLAELLRDFIDQVDIQRLVEKTVASINTSLTEDDDIEGLIRELRKV